MNGKQYLKNQLPVILINLLGMLAFALFLIASDNPIQTVLFILAVWSIVLVLSLLTFYFSRKKYLNKLLNMTEQLEERYLLPEIMQVPERADEQVFYQIMKMAEKSLVLPDDIDKLSDDSVITIYRGVKENDYKGLSWTIDKNTAIWFAKRFSNGDCYVFTGQLKKKDIIAYFNNRDEAEIVCDYRKIKHISCEKVQLMDSEKDKCSIPTSIEIFDTNCVKKRKCFKNG